MQIKVRHQQADTRTEKTFPESNPRGRRGEGSKVGEEIMQRAHRIPAKKWTAHTLLRRLKNYHSQHEQEGSFCLPQLPVRNSGIMVLFLLIPWLKEISSNGPRMNFHLVLYNGRSINERIKRRKKKQREREAGWGLLCYTATAGQEPARRAGEQERGESHGIHTSPVPPPGLNYGLQRWGKARPKHNLY